MNKKDLAPWWVVILLAPIQLLMLVGMLWAMIALVWEAWDDQGRRDNPESYPPELFSPTDYQPERR